MAGELSAESIKAMASRMEGDVGPRYQLIKPIGSGSYGFVWSAHDTSLEKHGPRGDVAIKQVCGAFDRTTDAKRLLREILLLKDLSHNGVLKLLDLFVPNSKDAENFDTIYIVMEMMDTDLHKIIQSPQPLTEQHLQYFLYQMVRGLRYIHARGVLHRDFKPSNILLNENCDLKICDFGLARTVNCTSEEEDMTEYVVTRWYRAPEVLLQDKHYTSAIDMWSCGCIFAEMARRKPLFAGSDHIDQLICIVDVLGSPPAGILEEMGSKQARGFLSQLPPRAGTGLSSQLPQMSEKAFDLLQQMLKFDPRQRIDAEAALSHPFLRGLHQAHEDDPPVRPFTHNLKLSGQHKYQLKELVLEKIVEGRPEFAQLLVRLREHHTVLLARHAEIKRLRAQGQSPSLFSPSMYGTPPTFTPPVNTPPTYTSLHNVKLSPHSSPPEGDGGRDATEVTSVRERSRCDSNDGVVL